MLQPEMLIIGATFIVAGMVKGITGMGLPTVALALLTATLGLEQAIVLMLLPSLFTNIWQSFQGGAFVAMVSRFKGLLLALTIGIALGTFLFTSIDVVWLSTLLGVLIVAYATFGLITPEIRLPRASEKLWSIPIGLANGILTGLTGSFVVPSVPYLRALELSRTELIQAMGIVFSLSTLILLFMFARYDLIPREAVMPAVLALAPAFLGMWLGQKIRDRLSGRAFQVSTLLALFAIGLFIIYKSQFSG